MLFLSPAAHQLYWVAKRDEDANRDAMQWNAPVLKLLCIPAAVADQLYRDSKYHEDVRCIAVLFNDVHSVRSSIICFVPAVADQLYRDSKYHEDVRRIAVHHLRSNAATYALFVPTDFWQYCWEMEQLGAVSLH